VAERDWLGLGAAVKSERSERLAPRVRNADSVVKSVCPYCAVGCGQDVYVEDGRVTQIEGDPDSPVSRGRLCPKGSASLQLTIGDACEYRVKYRRPFGKNWEDLDLDTAMDMIADRVISARRAGWQWEVDGARTRRTLGIASLGGATQVTDNSGRDRTTAFVYRLGWTQHTVGVQYIRTAAILQALLGNIGRPGGGILALRGHASIQGVHGHPHPV
jgi:formate dehydrogenase major subunit